jgi:hypothetical protein
VSTVEYGTPRRRSRSRPAWLLDLQQIAAKMVDSLLGDEM